MNLRYKGQSGNRLIRKLKHIFENNTTPEVETCFTYSAQKLASRFYTKKKKKNTETVWFTKLHADVKDVVSFTLEKQVED